MDRRSEWASQPKKTDLVPIAGIPVDDGLTVPGAMTTMITTAGIGITEPAAVVFSR